MHTYVYERACNLKLLRTETINLSNNVKVARMLFTPQKPLWLEIKLLGRLLHNQFGQVDTVSKKMRDEKTPVSESSQLTL